MAEKKLDNPIAHIVQTRNDIFKIFIELLSDINKSLLQNIQHKEINKIYNDFDKKIQKIDKLYQDNLKISIQINNLINLSIIKSDSKSSNDKLNNNISDLVDNTRLLIMTSNEYLEMIGMLTNFYKDIEIEIKIGSNIITITEFKQFKYDIDRYIFKTNKVLFELILSQNDMTKIIDDINKNYKKYFKFNSDIVQLYAIAIDKHRKQSNKLYTGIINETNPNLDEQIKSVNQYITLLNGLFNISDSIYQRTSILYLLSSNTIVTEKELPKKDTLIAEYHIKNTVNMIYNFDNLFDESKINKLYNVSNKSGINPTIIKRFKLLEESSYIPEQNNFIFNIADIESKYIYQKLDQNKYRLLLPKIYRIFSFTNLNLDQSNLGGDNINTDEKKTEMLYFYTVDKALQKIVSIENAELNQYKRNIYLLDDVNALIEKKEKVTNQMGVIKFKYYDYKSRHFKNPLLRSLGDVLLDNNKYNKNEILEISIMLFDYFSNIDENKLVFDKFFSSRYNFNNLNKLVPI